MRFSKKACKTFTKSYLNSIIGKEEVAAHLISKHNIRYLLKLMDRVHQAIIESRLSEFVRQYLQGFYAEDKEFPDWVVEGAKLAEIDISKNLKHRH